MYREKEFVEWMEDQPKRYGNKGTPSSYRAYLRRAVSYLKAIDPAFNLDKKLQELGPDGFARWVAPKTKNFDAPPNSIRNMRSALSAYVEFHTDALQHPKEEFQLRAIPESNAAFRDSIEEFRQWMKSQPYRYKETSVVSYTTNLRRTVSHLKRSDPAFDLDAKLQNLGPIGFKKWIVTEDFSAFPARPSDTRSHLRAYAEFRTGTQPPSASKSDFTDGSRDEEVANTQLFRMEKQMQAAVRAQLDELEPGLVAEDGGEETRVSLGGSTGWIDIVARDRNGKLVVIELKKGECPEDAPTQVLGYATALEEESGEEVRAYLIAGSFSNRVRTAARNRAMTGLELRTYEFSVRFNALTDQ